MPYNFTDRLKHAWNAFTSRDPTPSMMYGSSGSFYGGTSDRPDRKRTFMLNDNSIIHMIENKIAVDTAQVNIIHARVDEAGNYKETIKSGLNDALTVSANIDQTGRAFIQDLVMSILDEGCVAAVPTDTDLNPTLDSGQWDVLELRVGQIIEWYPKHIRVKVYNENSGKKEEIVVPKSSVAIIENPFYSIMNEPNSTLQRLMRTLRNLDAVNEQNASGKMDLIIQLPYSLKSPLKQQQAEGRRKQIEMQLVGSKYGIAYTDAAERITQLNRPVENNLWKEAQDLTAMLYNQLGLTQGMFDGSATDQQMTNYYNRTIEPILSAITEEMERKFLSKKARTTGQSIMYLRDPFKLITVTSIAQIAQTFTQNEIMTSNEIRSKVGLPPVDTERANELLNKQINKVEPGMEGMDPSMMQDPSMMGEYPEEEMDYYQNESNQAPMEKTDFEKIIEAIESG